MADNVSATGNRNTPKEIWNEGRVVGYSAYEIYVKQHLAEAPDIPVASEREWLASTLTSGSSLLLKVPAVTAKDEDSFNYIDIPLPATSILCAANTIVANFFDGEAYYPTYWATKVTDYGSCISNTSSSHPAETVNTPQTAVQHPENTDVPYQTTVPVNTELTSWPSDKVIALRNYMKIVDGVVIQPGKYENTESGSPQVELTEPNHNSAPFIRLLVKGAIDENHRPQILLTGFTISTVLYGTLGEDTSTDTNAPQNGDFLGPAVLPWANKIVFSVPNQYIAFFASGNYKRQLRYEPGTDPKKYRASTDQIVHSEPLIDLEQPAYCELVVDEATSSINLSSEYDDTYEPIAVYTCAYSPASLEFVAHWRLVPADPYWTVVFTSPVAAGTKLRVMMKRTSLDNYGWISQTTDEYLFNRPDDTSMATDKTGQQIRFKDRKENYFRDATINVYYDVPLVNSTSVLTVFQKKTVYPPALYATLVTKSTGTESMFPVDIVSPGSVKLFNVQDESDAKSIIEDYQETFPGTTAIVKDPMSGVFKSVSGHLEDNQTPGTSVYPVSEVNVHDDDTFIRHEVDSTTSDESRTIDPNEDDTYSRNKSTYLFDIETVHPLRFSKTSAGKDSTYSLPAARPFYTGNHDMNSCSDPRTLRDGELSGHPYQMSTKQSDVLDNVISSPVIYESARYIVTRAMPTVETIELEINSSLTISVDVLSYNPITHQVTFDIPSGVVESQITKITAYASNMYWAPIQSWESYTDPDYITWFDLIRALAGNKKIDLLGPELRNLKYQSMSGFKTMKLALAPNVISNNTYYGGMFYVKSDYQGGNDIYTIVGPTSNLSSLYSVDLRVDAMGYESLWQGQTDDTVDDSSTFNGSISVTCSHKTSDSSPELITYSHPDYSDNPPVPNPYRMLQLFGLNATDKTNVLNILKLIQYFAPHRSGDSVDRYNIAADYNLIEIRGCTAGNASDFLHLAGVTLRTIIRIDIGQICKTFEKTANESDEAYRERAWWNLDLTKLNIDTNVELRTKSDSSISPTHTYTAFCIPAIQVISTSQLSGFTAYPGNLQFPGSVIFQHTDDTLLKYFEASTDSGVPDSVIKNNYRAHGYIVLKDLGDDYPDDIKIEIGTN